MVRARRSRPPERRWIAGALALFAALCALLVFRATTAPDCAAGCRLADGVDLTIEIMPDGDRLWILELDTTRPGFTVDVRPFSRQPDGSHAYRLIPIDLAAATSGTIAAINLTRYHPAGWQQSYPGRRVQSTETVIVDGESSHIHAHSYLWYWDSSGKLHVSLEKPPSSDALAAAVTGFGVQGYLLRDGQPVAGSDVRSTRQRNTVVGADPDTGRFWIAVGSRTTQRQIAGRLAELGARFAAPVDGDNGSSLVLGPAAPAGFAFAGTRGLRPLGSIFYVTQAP